MNLKVAVVVTEPINIFLHNKGQHFLLVQLGCSALWTFTIFCTGNSIVLTAVQKQITLSRMTMDVNEEMNLTAFKRFLNHFFHSVYFNA